MSSTVPSSVPGPGKRKTVSRGPACGEKILDPTRDAQLVSKRMDQLIGYHVRRVQLTLSKSLDRELEAEITPALLHLLLIIDENPGVTMSKIAAAHGIDRASVAPAVQRMQRQGWIARVASPTDKRALMLRCTERGRARAFATLRKAQAVEAAVFGVLSGQEQKALLGLLHRIARAARPLPVSESEPTQLTIR
jgi:DNA-binding MarR family transcriptional regulator